ncbi:hypothetical protein HDU96_010742 [Phlyctochytrium bullatum]|nr:hypothetical protein HDU96_010742 [Phlyctochytrium bullatum]
MPEWTCADCEYENEEAETQCAACETPKPDGGGRYSGYKVGLIQSIEAIPKTKLKALSIDIGGPETIAVVTNGKNINEVGVKVVVATIGALVNVDGEDIQVKKSTVGGKKSEGILCDSVMLGWKGGGAGTAVILPSEFAVGGEPPAQKPRNQ